MAGLVLDWFLHFHVLDSAWLTVLDPVTCLYIAEPQFSFLVEHTSNRRFCDSPISGSDTMTFGSPLILQPLSRYKVCIGSLSPALVHFRTCLNSGFDTGLLPLHVEETFQSSIRQSTNANAVFDLVHGATVNSACTDYGLMNLDTYPLDWEGHLGPWNVASLLLRFGSSLTAFGARLKAAVRQKSWAWVVSCRYDCKLDASACPSASGSILDKPKQDSED